MAFKKAHTNHIKITTTVSAIDLALIGMWFEKQGVYPRSGSALIRDVINIFANEVGLDNPISFNEGMEWLEARGLIQPFGTKTAAKHNTGSRKIPKIGIGVPKSAATSMTPEEMEKALELMRKAKAEEK